MKKYFCLASVSILLTGSFLQSCTQSSSPVRPAPFSVWTRLVGTNVTGGTTGGHNGPYVAIDSQNNVYALATTDRDVPINGGASTISVHEAGKSDVFLVKYDYTGTQVMWAKAIGGSSNLTGPTLFTAGSLPSGVAVDINDNVYITGYTTATAFGEGALPNNSGSGAAAAFVSKYDTNGNLKWQRLLQTVTPGYYVSSTGIVCDSDDTVYISGITNNQIDDPASSTINGLTGTQRLPFLAKFNGLYGSTQWIHLGYTSGVNFGTTSGSIALDTSHRIYTMSNVKPGAPRLPEVIAYDEYGAPRWVTTLNVAIGSSPAYALKVSGSKVYIVGETGNPSTFPDGSGANDGTGPYLPALGAQGNAYVASFDADTGNNLKNIYVGLAGVKNYGKSLNIDSQGNLIIGTQTDTIVSKAQLIKLSPSLDISAPLFTTTLTSTAEVGIKSIAVDALDRIFTVGTVKGNLDSQTYPATAPLYNMFVSTFNSDGTKN